MIKFGLSKSPANPLFSKSSKKGRKLLVSNALSACIERLDEATAMPSVKTLVDTTLRPCLKVVRDNEEQIAELPVLQAIEQHTGVHPSVTGLVVLVSIGWYLRRWMHTRAQVVSTLVGIGYPIYCSVQAMEDKTDNEQLLSYWSLYGIVTLIDHWAEWLKKRLSVYYVPKILLLYWLFAKGGSVTVYRKYLKPLIAEYHKNTAKYTKPPKPFTVASEASIDGLNE